MKAFIVTGKSWSGKTTTVECIVRELVKRGYSVGTAKSIHAEDFSVDVPGTDTHRHMEAGSDITVAVGLRETALFVRRPLPIREIIRYYHQDFVVLEGFHEYPLPKILTATERSDLEIRFDSLVFAISGVVASQIKSYSGVRVINALDDVETLTDLVVAHAAIIDDLDLL